MVKIRCETKEIKMANYPMFRRFKSLEDDWKLVVWFVVYDVANWVLKLFFRLWDGMI
jgi:hypothetical protein